MRHDVWRLDAELLPDIRVGEVSQRVATVAVSPWQLPGLDLVRAQLAVQSVASAKNLNGRSVSLPGIVWPAVIPPLLFLAHSDVQLHRDLRQRLDAKRLAESTSQRRDLWGVPST